jgi:tetratricopeptide (TPR) repeat protein
MDPISLLAALATAFGIMSADAVMHADSVNVSLYVPDDIAKTTARGDVIEDMFISKMQEIGDVKSYFGRPNVQSNRARTLGVVLSRALKVEDFAAAVQHTFGMKTASVLGSFSKDDKEGKIQLVAMVRDPDEPPFPLIVKRNDYEPITDMVGRAAQQVMEHLAPYITTLYLLQQGDESHDYTQVDDLIARELVAYAAKSHNKERASVLNVAGIVALHKNNLPEAARLFEEADKADSDLLIPRLNRAFVMLATDHESEVESYLKPTLEAARYQRAYMLLAAGDVIRAGAHMSARKFDQAEAALDDAEYWDPTSSTVQTLRAEVKQERGDVVGAMKYKAKANVNLDNFETFPELASLYYHVSWRKGEPLRRNELKQDSARAVLTASSLGGKPAAETSKAK